MTELTSSWIKSVLGPLTTLLSSKFIGSAISESSLQPPLMTKPFVEYGHVTAGQGRAGQGEGGSYSSDLCTSKSELLSLLQNLLPLIIINRFIIIINPSSVLPISQARNLSVTSLFLLNCPNMYIFAAPVS